MTSKAEHKLCWNIAEAEGREFYPPAQGCIEEFIIRGTKRVSIYSYLTDPAETMRMLEALCEGAGLELDRNDNGDFFLDRKPYSESLKASANRIFGKNVCEATIEEAIAQAYLAMLPEKKEHGREDVT